LSPTAPAQSLSLLLIDDEEIIHRSIGDFLKRLGYTVRHAHKGDEGLAMYREHGADIIITDIRMPDLDGIGLLECLRAENADVEVILITGHGDLDTAVQALRRGAFDFFSKPVRLEELMASLERTQRYQKVKREKVRIEERLEVLMRTEDNNTRHELIGQSEPMRQVMDLVQKVSATNHTTVLIQGESGTGKELVAQAIHRLSRRAEAPFSVVNATAIPDTLFESELFGHEKGAFTDAKNMRKGLFELSRGGSLFLDEVGDLSSASQAKILRVLEERTVRRVGGGQEIAVDVRLIAATHQNLNHRIESGEFRQDLFFRLNVFTIRLPPLWQRGDDVILLAQHFLRSFSEEFGKEIHEISPEAIERLYRYPFPGNVRELRNLIERAVILCDGDVLTPAEFTDLTAATDAPTADAPLELAGLEEQAIRRALARSADNQTEAARLLGIGHDALRYRLKKYGI
jgi:two-component system, NtrC family, response regulator AtoC